MAVIESLIAEEIVARLLEKASLDELSLALGLKANLNSPEFTGNPTVPTQATSDNSTRIASTAHVKAVVAALVDSSPTALDTLNELAAALGDDANFATTMTNALAGKAPLISPAFSGNPTVPTVPITDDDDTIASTAFVHDVVEANMPSDGPSYTLSQIPAVGQWATNPFFTANGATGVVRDVGAMLLPVAHGYTIDQLMVSLLTAGPGEVATFTLQDENGVTIQILGTIALDTTGLKTLTFAAPIHLSPGGYRIRMSGVSTVPRFVIAKANGPQTGITTATPTTSSFTSTPFFKGSNTGVWAHQPVIYVRCSAVDPGEPTGEGTGGTSEGGGVAIRGKGAFQTLLPSSTWVVAGNDRAGRDGGWNSSMNGVLALMPIDAGRNQKITDAAFGIIAAQAAGTTALAIWGANADGYPTGLPVWNTEVTVNTSGDLKSFSVSPNIVQERGDRHFIGLVNLGWVGSGELHRQVTVNQYGVFSEHYLNDLNMLFNYSNQGYFSDTLFLSGVTALYDLDLTAVTAYTSRGDRPLAAVKVAWN